MVERRRTSEFASSVVPHWYRPDDESTGIVGAEGIRVRDEEGNEYLDFASQLYCVNLGYGNEAIAEAMHDQSKELPYVSPATPTGVRTRLADELVEVAPESLTGVFFSISGSEANESAAKLAREYTDGHKILTRWRSYHGSTYGAGSLTGNPGTRNALEKHAATTGAVKFLPPIWHRSPFNADSREELTELAADHLEFVIRNEGPDSVAAVLSEPIAGASGAYPAPPGYFERVREICDKYGVLLISDEVVAGFGRCGDWFGIQTEGVDPDMLTFAKGITSAYAPLAGVMMTEEIKEYTREEGYSTGQTFAGHPVSCAAGVAALSEYGNGVIEHVGELEPVFEERLSSIEDSYDAVGDVRGRGFLWAVEFTDPETGDPFVDQWLDDEDENPVDEVIDVAEERGLKVNGGRPSVHITIAPPLITTENDVHEAMDILERSIEDVFE